MTDDERFLRSRGWSQWYHPNYWVHIKTIKDPKRQDYTNYGMSLDKALRFELENQKPFGPVGDLAAALRIK